MKRRKLVLVLALSVLLGLLVLFFWPYSAGPPVCHLKIIRQTVQQGKTVVFFRVEGAKGRRIRFDHVEKVTAGATNEPVDMTGFFAIGSKAWPLGDVRQIRREFGIPAPTNPAVWKLRLTVYWDDPNDPTPLERLKKLPHMWKAARAAGSPLFAACWYSWNFFDSKGSQVLESDFITNAIPEP